MTRVAVLGGGVGSMVTAFELTRPEHKDRFEVTVYQPGWRLGGKGASGRGPNDRIEEHGLHVWFGFYENAFAVMRDCYRELGGYGPFETVWDAFKGCDDLIAFDRQGDGWFPLHVHCPPNAGRPGDGHAPKTVWEIAESIAERQLGFWMESFGRLLLHEFWRPRLWRDTLAALRGGARLVNQRTSGIGAPPGLRHGIRGRLAGSHPLRLAHELARARRTAGAAGPQRTIPPEIRLFADLMLDFRNLIWECFVESRAADDPELRAFFTSYDLWTCGTVGAVEDGVLEHGFDAINGEDLADWIERHGAKPVTVGDSRTERSPVLRAIYDLAFAYVDGDINQPNAAAGTAVNDLLRLAISHSGHMLYKMQAGMGDVVFGPLYTALRKRGVQFKFFHAIQGLHLDPLGESIETIDYVEQVPLRPGLSEYCPFVPVNGLDCWPNQPKWDELADGERLKAIPDLPSLLELTDNPLGRPTETLKRGADFDEVVLGISIGGLRPICGELIAASPRFAAAIDAARTTPTQGFQLWMNEPADKLGWKWGTNTVAGAYTEPIDTYCDMTHLIPRENVPGSESIAYFCAVLQAKPGETQQDATQRVADGARDFLKTEPRWLWARGVDASGALRPELLVGDLPDQYYRANISGTELYVLTPAGSLDARLPSDDSGFDNLVLAGDWTRNGVDGGCVESAATSGRQAARRLTGSTAPIPGEDRAWLRGSRPYVEYGPVQTSPGPFRCTGTKGLGFLVPADEVKLRALAARVLDAASTTGRKYRPITSHVVVTIGHVAAITSTNPPFANRGSVPEWQVATNILAFAGHEELGVFIPQRMVLFTPYVIVDNPISLCGGREIYGLSKTLGQFATGQPGTWREQAIGVDVFGGDFGPKLSPRWTGLVSASPAGPHGGPAPAWTKPAEFGGWLLSEIGDGLAEGFAAGAIDLVGAFTGWFDIDGWVAAVKQFRDPNDGTMACYSRLLESSMKITSFGGRPSPQSWNVDFATIESHPLVTELGLRGVQGATAFEIEMDFDLGGAEYY